MKRTTLQCFLVVTALLQIIFFLSMDTKVNESEVAILSKANVRSFSRLSCEMRCCN